jgi:hypothetical protein
VHFLTLGYNFDMGFTAQGARDPVPEYRVVID